MIYTAYKKTYILKTSMRVSPCKNSTRHIFFVSYVDVKPITDLNSEKRAKLAHMMYGLFMSE